MSENIATLGYVVKTDQLKKGERALNDVTKAGKKTESSIGGVTKGLGLMAAAWVAVSQVQNLTNISRQFDVLNAQLITATGSAENAAVAFGALQQFASETPYDLQQTVKAFNQLVNLGLTPSEAALKSYGNTAAAMGKDLSQLVEAVADAATGEFERLKEFGIKAKSQGDQVSFTFRGVTETVGKNAREIEQYLMALGDNEFAGAMETRAATLDGALSNLGDTWDNLYLTISQNGAGQLIEGSVRGATNAVQGAIDIINSGALSAMADAILTPFQRLFDSIGSGFDYATNLVGFSSEEWSSSILGFIGSLYKNINLIPSYYEYAFNSVTATISSWVNKAEVYGQLFVDVMTAKLNEYAEKAKIYGKAAANALNPFSDDYDSDSALQTASAYSAEIISMMKWQADSEIKFINESKDNELSASSQRLEAVKYEYEQKLGLSKQLLEQYKLEQSATVDGDRLAGFGVGSSGGSSSGGSSKLSEYDKWLEKVRLATGLQKQLTDEIEKTQKAIAAGDLSEAAGSEYIDTLQKQIDGLNNSNVTVFDSISSSAKDGLSSIQSLYEQGSKEYQKLGIAIQAVSAIQAVFGVINQATGEPYTALGRMAAMASTMAALGYSVGAISGTDTTAADNQANQGLTVWGDKSESIANSIELTEDATSKLVGINTNMLSALQSMAQNLSKASALISRDGSGDFSPPSMPSSLFSSGKMQSLAGITFDISNAMSLGTLGLFDSIMGNLFSDLLGGIFGTIGKIFGGSSSVTDSGIKIIGESITDMIDNITVQAFQDIKSKKYAWSSSKHSTQIQDISNQVGGQFELVLSSMVDAVGAAADALGISQSTINSRLNAFRIATTDISLKDLSAEEQQAEIQAVFSKIFDDLAVAIVPFADDFQEVGEGLGETLTRLAVQMQVTQAASDQLGFQFGNMSAEMNAYISNELSDLVGGVSNLATMTSSFVDSFASDEKKLEINTGALTSALQSVGLSIPSTAAGFYDLMSTLDASTEAGREQIATLLNIQDVAKDYYDLIDDGSAAQEKAAQDLAATNSEFNALTENLRGMVISMYDLGDASSQVTLDMALAAAKAGDFDLAKSFTGVDINQSDFSSLADFQIAQAQAANKIEELADLTESQVSVEERQLNKLDEINKELASQREQLQEMKYANESNAKSSAASVKLLQQISGYGINVKVVEQ
ncbi:tape measure protein [Vibrio casei]|uniref:tape measure protein n=1 Tax=Vibrio casei TaxID=673372 RepID=UPI003F9DBC1A